MSIDRLEFDSTARAMATPTISAGWAPPDQACLRINDYWIWDYQAPRDARTVLGGPSQITDCLPTPWASAVTYEATGCPPQYTSACRGPDFNAPVTCCPTAYSFSCLPQSLHTGPHAIQFRCQSRHAASGNIVVTRTAFAANTIAAESRVRSTNEHLFALALMYTTPVRSYRFSSSLAAPC
ncbi:hypothetical protein GGS23DRAFT_258029 [Durotheca rogersii]|uniref:uncharacterized protein n=1 Tax=Durotheca rogersii TaxID=419775 RepID=UPI00221F8539|nr:uncharacterized protein GGS23DRAFT_258029 [Durotheca rogersii]KAI5859999.1 hypothetical protein GGS23DRAFT_258029 [Durotheca rogersii]